MELRDALAQISHIREHMARTEIFRGYRSLTVGFTGCLALLGAIAQSVWLPRPMEELNAYLTLWLGVAAIAVTVEGVEVWVRACKSESTVARQLAVLAVEQFLPCVAAGALVTAAIILQSPEAAWMLPGLWAVLFSLGVFASYRLLPRATFYIGAYYLAAGVALLSLAHGEAALAPWTMGVTFGGGQLAGAAILYFALERTDH
ncbi:MAG: hypothetical protein HY000_13885 [Planctomycetes bacterium]|nr:hypothetical protein [Planctomycetota bacterium]